MGVAEIVARRMQIGSELQGAFEGARSLGPVPALL
jgi:hypothetical protein